MATTTGGTTYVTSTDLVADYPTASLALANRVDVVASGGPVLVKTAGYTITVADILSGNKFLYNSASGGTFTFPTASLVDGMVIQVSQIGAGALTVSGGTIVGTTVTTAQYQSLRFVYVSSATSWYSVLPPSTAPGLAIVSPTSITNSGGSASASGGAVTFTGVSSVSLNGVFTSTYDNYRIMIYMAGSTTQVVQSRLRAAGTDASAANYTFQEMKFEGATVSGARATSQTFAQLGYAGTAEPNVFAVDVYRPALAAVTGLRSTGIYGYLGATIWDYAASHSLATSYDGISIIPNTGNSTGVIRVYGYRNS